MPFTQILILAAVQGITEFLPISSSGHLILVPKLGGLADQGLLMDVAVHVGTLLAVMLYFWRDMIGMTGALIRTFGQVANRRRFDPEYWLFLKLVLATLPVIVAGFLVNKYMGADLRTLEVIGWATLGFGILLYISDKMNMTVRQMEHISFGGAFFIGLMQVIALVPGTSRAGITMTAARFLGVERQDAARFSLLLSIPTIIGAGVLKGYELYKSGDPVLLNDAVTVAGLAFLFALIAISLLMVWLRRASFTPFVIYRILLGGALVGIAYYAPDFTF
ncbi:MAG: undecaprenyl-diphosphate phosphatase [Rhodospirillaceae bacterium]|nr:undecaprenyl-diphosphate phosphatase [Rhodospirillaceae bacterium]MBT4587705.1 undecaprenyl-diphosphate phosphatase [Rhodospirillaceae bacterium]MBT5940822.1 undecaprenyl-diphosphate phosphatase [Rhodospirillaceae bacterium]MBT7955218.1 undecaprenyl-diphosphate phosphatase [Rhodospirillaceae bacterium]